MAGKRVLLLPLGFALLIFLGSAEAQLRLGFYEKTCPAAETIVRQEIARALSVAPSLGAPLLRLFFHDCFVRGCDASVLLNRTSSAAGGTEKEAVPNQFLRGLGLIDGIKARLEQACPATVSCADLLALVARDVVHLDQGPHWDVPTGRRDGRVSVQDEALRLLPPFFANISALKSAFAGVGLDAKDLVVLSGGHTIGNAHCLSFQNRIYNFSGRGDSADVDPAMDRNYVATLRAKCGPTAADANKMVEMDPGSFKTFDNGYFKLVAKRRGLFQSDAALLDDPETRAHVFRLANATAEVFFQDFAASMVRMGNVSVLTGAGQGEIRKHCALVN